MADHNSPKQTLQAIVATQRQRQAEREREPYGVFIDDPPVQGHYVAIMETHDGHDVVVRRVQLPVHGEATLTVYEGRVTRVDVRVGAKV